MASQTLAQQVQEKAAQIAEASYFADEDGIVPMSPTRIAARIRNELRLEPAEESTQDVEIRVVVDPESEEPDFSTGALPVKIRVGEHTGEYWFSQDELIDMLNWFPPGCD